MWSTIGKLLSLIINPYYESHSSSRVLKVEKNSEVTDFLTVQSEFFLLMTFTLPIYSDKYRDTNDQKEGQKNWVPVPS